MEAEKLDRTWLCSVLFMDIVGYSMKSVQIQAWLKERFKGYVSQAIRDVAENDRVVLDTGDGAAICFLGAPEAAMFTGLKLRSAFVNDALEHEHGLKVRIGINLGPVKLVRDINENLNAIGDGINTAQRVMAFAGENQVLVSRSFFEVVSLLSDDFEQLFRYEGVRKDKHIREHQVYQLVPPGQEGVAPAAPQHEQEPGPAPEAAVELTRTVGFDSDTLASLRTLLAPIVGPIAGHLVKQSAGHARDTGGLVHELAEQISHPGTRAKFLAQAAHLADVTTEPSPAPKVQSLEREATPTWDADWLEKARKELAARIGPMARVLVDRTAKRVRSRKELCDALSAEVPAGQRESFLKALA
jgi:class 3 adenylate cyclase